MRKKLPSMVYNGVVVTLRRSKYAKKGVLYVIKSPVNGKQRIFEDEECLKNYIDNAETLESIGDALARDPW